MRLADFLFAALIGAMAGILVGYFVFADQGELGGGTLSIWLDHNLNGSVPSQVLEAAICWSLAASHATGSAGLRRAPKPSVQLDG